ncbi:MFS transporter [Capnocytophaga sp. ARDL2]|uniref:MFS transporter n=1 Tax=Capnocytophaga sp. ARDL2 TaxID=3238809 RepID=UPI00355626F2
MSLKTQNTIYPILIAISLAHLLNDMLQAVIPAIYPLLEAKYQLSYAQIGMITLCYQFSASVFQPIVGAYTDKNPKPYSQLIGMFFTMIGIGLLANAQNYYLILISVFMVGIGSSIFHPESSRVSFLASGGRRSLAQSVFQIGGNTGTALAPLLIAWWILPNDSSYLIYFIGVAILAQIILAYIAQWYKNYLKTNRSTQKKTLKIPELSQLKITTTVGILLVLIFSKYFYVASITSFFQFYTLKKFGVSTAQAQIYLFYFLLAVAIGTLIGGFLGDRFGRKAIIVFSVFGAAPFALLLPYATLEWTVVLTIIIGMIMASAFPAILVYAQELLPKKLGMISGLFYGFAFGMAGVGSAVLGYFADKTSIEYIYHICSFLPLIGFVAFFLPNLKKISYRIF